ncbi:MAG: D-alanyl-D-alanine carboxypeptidase family protein [Parafilimonas terrae]|nr:D-alanyl-D-alanine carboxypeptidase family protein [Parafilimonas terrae]
MSLTSQDRDLLHLHPNMRSRVESVLADIEKAKLPLRLFEGWRSPERQRYLYAQGRTRPGPKVTFARAWESYHQYGLAVDLVGFVNEKWTWDLPGAVWKQMHAIGAAHGLERLGFETPHLQLAGLKIGDLMEGDLPEGEDESWHRNFADAVQRWDGTPPAPTLSSGEPARPALAEIGRSSGLDWSKTPAPVQTDWHALFDGQEWRCDGAGLYLRSNETKPVRSPGAPTTCQLILDLYGEAICKASLRHTVPPELIVMTIATETAMARDTDFTGPETFRWEAAVEVTDVKPKTFGDYSAGPMQTLATTARDVIRRLKLGYPDPFAVAPYLATRPSPAPSQNPLYDGQTNIDLGTAEIRTRLSKTGSDPILVAAAFNAGGLYRSERNPWHLRTANDHLDRAAQWYGDACFVLASLR